MTVDRPRAQEPDVVSSVAGMVVAVVSAVFGICAHGMAAGTGIALPSSGQLLFLLAASAGIGAATAALARRRSPVLMAAGGLIVGQGVVHLAMVAGHGGHAGHGSHSGSSGQSGPALGHAAHTPDPDAIRAAMDGAAGTAAGAGGAGGAGSHADALLTPGMLGAHIVAVALTLSVVALLSGALAWIAARVARMWEWADLVVVDTSPAPLGRIVAPDPRFLRASGGTRAPPVGV